MARPPRAPSREELAPSEREALDRVLERGARMGRGEVTPYWAAVANWPEYADTLATQGRLVRSAGERSGTYSHAEREWVDQVLCAAWKTNIVLKSHIPDAVAVGVRLEAIVALREGREDDLTEHERFLAAYIRAVADGAVTDAAYEALEARMGKRGAVEYTIFICHLMRTIRLTQALGIADPPDAEIDVLLGELRAGTHERLAPRIS